MTFEFYPLRFHFLAEDAIYFPGGKPGNILRGAFGSIFKTQACTPDCREARTCPRRAQCAYARIFEPASLGGGPSGLADWPRPFVFRAAHLDGAIIPDGRPFHFDLHVFLREPALAQFAQTFARLAEDGLGPRRGRARLTSVWLLDRRDNPGLQVHDGAALLADNPPPPLSVPLAPAAHVCEVRIDFVTPTELKSGEQLAARPEFPILFARIRDRISTLRALYGAGPLDIDFQAMGEQATSVQMTRCELRQVDVTRRSARTGRTHSLGGFVGSAVYHGELTAFIPFLETAYWTGVGRQTVWGKGEIRTAIVREC